MTIEHESKRFMRLRKLKTSTRRMQNTRFSAAMLIKATSVAIQSIALAIEANEEVRNSITELRKAKDKSQ